MEMIKFICEFFFGNFWHWLELLIIIAVASGTSLVSFNYYVNKDKDEE